LKKEEGGSLDVCAFMTCIQAGWPKASAPKHNVDGEKQSNQKIYV